MSYVFRSEDLLALVSSPACEVLYSLALKVKVWKQYDLLFLKLAEFLRHNHIRMSIILIKLNYKSVAAKSGSNSRLKTCTCKGLPVLFFAFDHGLIRFWNSSVQIQVLTKFLIRLEFSSKFFFVILDKLFFHHSNDG